MTNLNSILILSPHFDDECLGCGGIITSDKVSQVHIRYYNNVHPLVDYTNYVNEAREVAKHGGFEYSMSPLTGVNHLNMYPLADFIHDIETICNELKPSALFIPARSRNEDHKVIYDAAKVAIRAHDINYFIPFVVAYEQPEYLDSTFEPTYFIPIDIENKMKLFSYYKSQHRSYRTEEQLKALAILRGSHVNLPFAEAFQIIRQVG